ncbi:hypothetical protein PG_1233 [Porphyromonas gingivalis W83]|uniref:Uncharacterized protein n=2 Tax=Porphyromonas gingivalis TaxID=837 RepID=Q7MV62_PORGI|nr:hypothetical protein PG_1233 [Porphyromonas gingivalis W83]BAG33887.1 conserved hypothetical protein [Porphyromonas gingivalis ATCC 33277]
MSRMSEHSPAGLVFEVGPMDKGSFIILDSYHPTVKK